VGGVLKTEAARKALLARGSESCNSFVMSNLNQSEIDGESSAGLSRERGRGWRVHIVCMHWPPVLGVCAAAGVQLHTCSCTPAGGNGEPAHRQGCPAVCRMSKRGGDDASARGAVMIGSKPGVFICQRAGSVYTHAWRWKVNNQGALPMHAPSLAV